MNKKYLSAIILIASLLVSIHAKSASEEKQDWFCTDDQAMKTGSTYVICGVGTYSTEGDARRIALENAVNEFKTICDLSSDCKGHKVSIEPKRSSCYNGTSADKTRFENFSCHRMFLFTVQ